MDSPWWKSGCFDHQSYEFSGGITVAVVLGCPTWKGDLLLGLDGLVMILQVKKKQQIPQVAQMVNGQKVRKYQKTQKNTCRKYTTHSNRNMSKLLFVQAQESRETICLLVISMNLRCCHLTKPRFYMIVLPLQLLQLTQDSEGTDILLSDFDVAIPMEKKHQFWESCCNTYCVSTVKL